MLAPRRDGTKFREGRELPIGPTDRRLRGRSLVGRRDNGLSFLYKKREVHRPVEHLNQEAMMNFIFVLCFMAFCATVLKAPRTESDDVLSAL